MHGQAPTLLNTIAVSELHGFGELHSNKNKGCVRAKWDTAELVEVV